MGLDCLKPPAIAGGMPNPSCAGFPARNVLELFRRQRVDRDAERAQLEARDLSVNFSRQQVNARPELALVLHQILD